MYKYILFILFIIILTIFFIYKLLRNENFSNFNCDLIPNSDTCTIKIKGDDGEKGMEGNYGYKGLKGSKGKDGLSGSLGINGKEIPNIEFKEIGNENRLLGIYNSYDKNAYTKKINISRGSNGITAVIPPLKLIYNDSNNDKTINVTERNETLEPIIINLKNVKGRKGNRGPDGTCSDGETGPTGDTGRQGNRGPPGKDGEDGPMGGDGVDGPTQKNVKYNIVKSKNYCFIKNESSPLCISKDSYDNYYSSIESIGNYKLDTSNIVKTGRTPLKDEPSEDSEFNQQCIQCPCGKINNGSGECIDDDTNIVIFNKSGNCHSFLGDKKFTDIGDNWNDNVNKIHLPPGVKITAHIHDHKRWEGCHQYNNDDAEVMKINPPEGISFISYNKVCTDFPEPPPPPPPASEIAWGGWQEKSYQVGASIQSSWRDNAWQVVGERNTGIQYLMIIHDTRLIYAGGGDKKGETSNIIVTNKNNNNKFREYRRIGTPHGDDDIRLSWVNDHKSSDWFNGPFFVSDSYDHWTLTGPSFSFEWREGCRGGPCPAPAAAPSQGGRGRGRGRGA